MKPEAGGGVGVLPLPLPMGVDVRRALPGWQHGGRRGGFYQRMLLHPGEHTAAAQSNFPPDRAQVLTDDQIKEPIKACERRRADSCVASPRRWAGTCRRSAGRFGATSATPVTVGVVVENSFRQLRASGRLACFAALRLCGVDGGMVAR